MHRLGGGGSVRCRKGFLQAFLELALEFFLRLSFRPAYRLLSRASLALTQMGGGRAEVNRAAASSAGVARAWSAG